MKIETINYYLIITLGGAIQGLAMAIFLFPHAIPSGGSGGLAVLLNYWFQLPIGFALWLVNFSLLIVAVKWLGNMSAIGTMYAITVTSVSINLYNTHLPEIGGFVWIDLLTGAILLGIGVGLLLRIGVSNGGMGVLALVYSTYRGGPPGKPLFFMNGAIFLLTASMIAWEIVIQAVICQLISTRVVDGICRVKLDLPISVAVTRRTRK
ncbi:YitT family protein [Desertibacillus haloalkaliphilus]|uniref:YitT family protein n=1 Tax=Desertibacillus haloalkaliphilus TaxID=1328930 RepID=UPI001C25B0CB|nr:YitT family protein [Desertibacillus haloalkaliphilus]MBU8906939.1 YitT family protein [Desertibacillus haloalkaliphilus]